MLEGVGFGFFLKGGRGIWSFNSSFFPKNAIPPHPPSVAGGANGEICPYLLLLGGWGNGGEWRFMGFSVFFFFEMEGEGNGFVSHSNNT